MYSLKLAFKNILHKKARTVFTTLSIAIGVTSVLVISIISGLGKTAMNNELDSLGINGLMVGARSVDGSSVLNQNDLNKIRNMDNVESAIPIITVSGNVSINGKLQPVIIWGIDSGAQGIITFQLVDGEDITNENVSSKEYCCLIDDKIGNSIGDTIQLVVDKEFYNIKIKGSVTIDSGIMKSLAGDYIPPILYLPYTTVQQMVGKDDISQIAIKINESNNENIDVIGKNIEREIYSLKNSTDTVTTQNLVQQRNKLNNLLNIISAALSAIGLVSLIVAGISIMTVMMMSVNERTKEIGIKRAIGAGKRTVMSELLVETIIICLIGSVVGILITYIISLIGNNYGFDAKVSTTQIFTTVISAVVGGILFGLYPSYLAAKLNPVDALRKD